MMFARHLMVRLLVLALWGIGTLAQGAPSARLTKDDESDIISSHQGPPHRIAFAHNHHHHARPAHHDHHAHQDIALLDHEHASMDEEHIEAQGHQGIHAHHGHHGHHGRRGHHGLHGLHAHHGEHGYHPGLHGHHGLHGLGRADPGHHLGPHAHGIHGHHAHGHGHHHAHVGHHHQMYPEITTHTHHHHHIPKHEPHADHALHNLEHGHHELGHGRKHGHVHEHGHHHEPSEWYWFKISNRLPHDTVLNVQCRDDQGLNERHKDVLNHKFVMNFKMQDQEYWTCLMKFEGTKACKEVKVWEKLHSELDCEFCTWKVTSEGMFVKEWSEENKKDVWVFKHAWEDCDSGLPWDGM